MSYILDALKKAEADRDPDARASLAMAQHERRRNRWLAYAVVIALVANAAILLWLFLPEQNPDATAAGRESSAQQPAKLTNPGAQSPQTLPAIPEPASAGRDTTPASQAPARESPVDVAAPAPAASRPANTMAAESATGETIIGPGTAPASVAEPQPVSSLPSGQRQRFPTLEFSTHIYADDADLRAIVVNGSRLQEGDRLGSLRLQEITEEGAVFRFEDRLVSVSVLDAWN